MLSRSLTTQETETYKHKDEKGSFLWDNLRRRGGNSRPTDRPGQWYPLYIKPDTKKVSVDPFDDSEEVWPIDPKGEKRIWRDNPDGARRDIENGEISVIEKKGRYEVVKKSRMPEGKKPKTLWANSKYSATTHGTKLLMDIIGSQQFSYPKSLHLVMECLQYWIDRNSMTLDFFAGSGTTGHGIINLNRKDKGNRKFLLAELGEHFDNVMLPRMKKVIYSPNWKNGKPISRDGITQQFKYVRLESYEDTMDSLIVTPLSDGQKDLLIKNRELAEDYRLRYSLGVETSDSATLLGNEFRDPFAYTLSVVRDGVRREVSIDLPETFNYLIGLRIESHRRIGDVLAITGVDAERRHCLILWRNLDQTDYTALDAWFERHRQQFSGPLDRIYANGDHTLNAMQRPGEAWTAESIEPMFRELIFEGSDNG